MWYIIMFSDKKHIIGPFVSRSAAYDWLANHGGVEHGRVLSDRAAQQTELHRETIHPTAVS
jgi:hypothetical protein